MRQITDLTWEHHSASAGKPAYDEADVSEWFGQHVSEEYDEWIHVTIRKYPTRYFVAFSFHLWGELELIDYTQDGDGDGRIEHSPIYLAIKTPHRDFEQGFDTYMQQLDELIKRVIERTDTYA